MTKSIKSYSELIKYTNFLDRFNYLRIGGQVGIETFGIDRYLNQAFYCSKEWKRVRDLVIMRDGACDLGIKGREIWGGVMIHHMNPITAEDIANRNPMILDPEFLITTAKMTHQAIHYGDENLLMLDPVERKPNDTIPWR